MNVGQAQRRMPTKGSREKREGGRKRGVSKMECMGPGGVKGQGSSPVVGCHPSILNGLLCYNVELFCISPSSFTLPKNSTNLKTALCKWLSGGNWRGYVLTLDPHTAEQRTMWGARSPDARWLW